MKAIAKSAKAHLAAKKCCSGEEPAKCYIATWGQKLLLS